VRAAEIMWTWFVSNAVNDTDIRAVPGKSPSAADVRAAIASARAAGLAVVLKPHVDCLDGVWRANIGTRFSTDAQWAAWFASYSAFIDAALALARADGLPVLGFNVGTELDGTHAREAEWRAVISRVRAALPPPTLLWLGPNWEWAHAPGYTLVRFWDALDLIGVDMYAPLAAADDPPLATAVAGWASLVANLSAFSAAHGGKRVVFAEMGYASWVHAATDAPGCCAGVPDPATQAVLYESFFAAVWPQPWFAGAFPWAWPDTRPDGDPCGTDFSVYAKPAAAVFRDHYGAPPPPPRAAPRVAVYSDGSRGAWADYSWSAAVDWAAAADAYPGHAASAAASVRAGGGALALHAPAPVPLAGLSALVFDVRAPNATAAAALEVYLCACADCSACAVLLPHASVANWAPPAAPCTVARDWAADPAAARVRVPLAALMPGGGAPWPAAVERVQVGAGAAVDFGVDNIAFE